MVIEQLDRTGPSQTPARDNDRDSLVGLYFRDASRYQILTEDQEKRLSRRLSLCFRVIHRELALPEDTPHTFREIIGSLGDAGALTTRCRRAYHLSLDCRRTLIQSNLRLAVHIARRFGQHGIPMPDLIQDANVGLIKAAERFDPSKGFRFSTYAYWWISEEVKRCLQRGVRVVHTPEGVVDEIRELQRVSLRLNRALGREPSQAELAREMEASPSRIGELRALASREVSTDAPLLDDSSITLGDSLAGSSRMTPDHPMAERDRRRALRAMLAELTERERDILARRFGLDLPAPETLQVISDNLGISRERVRQIEKGALKKLQSRFVRLDEAYGA
ncbi:sigma-70 family RNA polymerase sigma factor [Marinobacter sp. C2H3]|uniref:sigma-70 family RNA polymerase sigma factor n=1 Tax=Marinobacter sp. C2H3 TaxID=3119003 RepID=UPI00300EA5A4